MDAARALVAHEALFSVPGAELRGFDEFMDWYASRLTERPAFRYDVLDTLGGQRHAAAVIRLSDGLRTWRQVAVYEVAEGRITSMAAYEDPPGE